jgi:hypothetical protein
MDTYSKRISKLAEEVKGLDKIYVESEGRSETIGHRLVGVCAELVTSDNPEAIRIGIAAERHVAAYSKPRSVLEKSAVISLSLDASNLPDLKEQARIYTALATCDEYPSARDRARRTLNVLERMEHLPLEARERIRKFRSSVSQLAL